MNTCSQQNQITKKKLASKILKIKKKIFFYNLPSKIDTIINYLFPQNSSIEKFEKKGILNFFEIEKNYRHQSK